jgi:4-aminobutyrate aminotransferase / (S)-3-amino-2-methylpropionate transaminase / 5-aminovalerate transaminase
MIRLMIEQKRILATSVPGPASVEMARRKAAAVAAGVGTGMPVYVVEAAGGILRDADGNQLIDLGSGIAVTTVGNGNPRVVEAVTEQVRQFTHTCFMVTPYDKYVAVCEKLNALTPGDHEKRSALFNSGAEAVENAVKIARHATGRPAVVAFEHGYHGRTNLTMALTAKNMPYKHRFGPFAPEVYRVPMAYPYRWPTGPENCAEEALRTVTDMIHAQVGEENCAAVVIEPIQGEGGFIVPPEGFLPGLAQWCREHGILLIADEVQSGFCRTGDWFACDHEGVVPDLVTTAKGIAGGMPLAAVTGRAEIMDAVHVGGLGGTYGGNPVACAAALASIESMEEDDLAGRAREIGEVLVERLGRLEAEHDEVGEVRGRGAMVAMELVTDGASKEPNAALAAAVSRGCFERGVVTLTCGTYGNVFRFLPPLSISDELLHEAMDVLEEAFAAALA